MQENLIKAYNNQQQEIKRQEEIIEFRAYGSEINPQGPSREKMLEEIERIEKPAGNRRFDSFWNRIS